MAMTEESSKGHSVTMDSMAPEAEMAPMEPKEEFGGDYAAGGVDGGSGVEIGRKMIRTAELQLETTEFEAAVEGLNALTEQMGGYFENSSVANRKSGSRWADYTIRIPSTRYELFMNQVGELCHETWREANAQNITEAYYDTQGRLKTQQIKLERLQELLSKAELMEDIITIESAISETEWMIDELSGTLRHYDSKVDYATIYINLREVYKLSNVEMVPDTFGQRMGAAFASGVSDFGEFLEDLAVSLAYGWIWWLIVIVVVVVVVRVLRKKSVLRLPRRRKKTDDKQDEN
jgi:hypothetical protein